MGAGSWLAQGAAAVRVVLILTVLLGLVYPFGMAAIGQLPRLRDQAGGSLVEGTGGDIAGSRLIGQAFTDADGTPLPQYFQSRPSNAGTGYDPAATAAGNLGGESVVDTPEKLSLLTQVCARSHAAGELEGVDGRRPYCTDDGVGAVLGVYRAGGLTGRADRAVSLNQPCPATPFIPVYEGVAVECAAPGETHAGAVVTPVRGDAPAHPVVPADAITGSGSGLDPHISPAYAELQSARIARERGADPGAVADLIARHTTDRHLGALGDPVVNVLELNLALDRFHPIEES